MSQLLERFAARASDPRPIVVGEASHAEVVRRAVAIAGHLDRLASGERVAILVDPGADFIAAFFGALLAGACVVVLSPLHPAPETRYFCGDAGVRTVIVSAALREHARGLEADFVVRDVSGMTAGGDPTAAAALASGIAERAPALQLYTSGTTGKPKGAVLTHRNIGIQQELVGQAWGFSASDVLLHALPLHHMHGLAISLLTAIGAGATARMLRAFDARAVWEEMASATVFMGVPAMYHRLFVALDAATPDERARWAASARGLRLATSGSAALPVTLAERWRELTGTIPLERFGMTEIGVGITNALDGPRFAGCVGLPLPTVEARVVGDDPSLPGDALVGELWIRGPSVFVGYHGKEAETRSAFVPDPDGAWFRTGDTVTRDEALPGRPFRILGRSSVDILKSGGYKLSALEIEEVLREHAGVSEVAVVGVADEAWGERVVACVVRRDASACDAVQLRAFVRERLAPYKVPKDVLFLSELPKNALGKVVKPDLVRQIAGELGRP